MDKNYIIAQRMNQSKVETFFHCDVDSQQSDT